MSNLMITARALSKNIETQFQNIKSMRVVSSIDSPAQSLSAVVALNRFNGDFGEVRAYYGKELLFNGKIDCQQDKISGSGMITRFDARSSGSLLLDNQALPSVLLGVQIQVLFNRCIAPYGFSLYNPNRAAYVPVFTIRAGTSEWDALVNFSRRAYGLTPYIKGTQVIVGRLGGNRPVTVSNDSDGVKYTSLTHTKTPYNIISRVILRDENGGYTLAVRNSAASYTGAVRKRYVVPGSEYADSLDLDANRRIRRSMLEYEQVDIVLPGFFDISPGDDIIVLDDKITTKTMIVCEREYSANQNGFLTKLKIINPAYYD